MLDTLVQPERIRDLLAGVNGLYATFEWDADRVTGVSNAGWTTVIFNSPFSTYPVVAVHPENGSDTQMRIRNLTKTGFQIQSDIGAPHPVHYMAFTPGVWVVNGILVYALEHTVVTSGTYHQGVSFLRPFARTPAMAGSYAGSGPVDPGNGVIEIGGFSSIQNGITSDLNSATKSVYLNATSNTQHGRGILAVEPTGAAVNGSNPVSGGSGSFKAGHKIEAGVFRDAAAGSGTLTFASAFGAAPAVVGILSRAFDSGIVSSGPHRWRLSANPSTAAFSYGDSTTPCGIHWIAMTRGFNSTSARRLI